MDQQLLDEVRHYFRLQCEQSGMTVDEAINQLMERVNMDAIEIWNELKEERSEEDNNGM